MNRSDRVMKYADLTQAWHNRAVRHNTVRRRGRPVTRTRGAVVDSSEAEYLLRLWDLNICPQCGRKIPEGTRVGSGQKSKGGFCSLDHYARYYEAEIVERMKQLNELVRRHRDS